MAEIIFEIVCYFTGRLLLPLLSLGRIKVDPLREPSGRARGLPAQAARHIVAGDGWCIFAGLLFWASIIVLLVRLFAKRASL